MSHPFSDKSTIAIPADVLRAERLAKTLDNYMQELENGGIPPDLDALIAQHPDLADELRSYADSLQMLHQMTAGMRATPTRAEPPAEGLATKRLGDYQIVREIGRGGMGIVYEALQLSLNRQVALKVLPFAAMLDEKQIARFRNEAQAAAQLHHPNIVPVHGVGQERGVHYFAMQYVPGQSLEAALQELRNGPNESEAAGGATEHAAADTATWEAFSTRASTRSRGYCQSVARLMIQAADAIQHAHEYGVIHRDVKPSNLLLDRNGKLWVTDFGLARMQSDSGVTMTGDVVGTLRYMSPEQAAGATGLVDGRADVYSLGATLYELLTLRPAHSGDNRQAVLRHIETQEPTPPRSLNPAIPLDLETITLRALAKARDERYPSAQALADDLRSFLEGRPTVAQRPTVLDRVAKWALRHRAAVSGAALALLVIALVAVTAAVLISREQGRTEQALASVQESLRLAEQSDKRARDVVDRFGSGFANELVGVPGTEPLRQRLLNETLAYYRQFIEQSANDPRLERELAEAYLKAAGIAESLGARSEALQLCRDALAAYDRLHEAAPDDAALALRRATAQGTLGLLLAGSGNTEAALAAYDAAIKSQQALVQRSANVDAARALADTQNKLGLLLAELGRKEEARRSLRAAIAVVSRLAGQPDSVPEVRHELALCYNNLSFVERDLDWGRAEAACRRAISLLEKLVDENEPALAYRADLAISYNNLGAILANSRNLAAASDSYRRAIKWQEQLVRQAPAIVNYRSELAVSWNNLGQSLHASGSVEQAAEAYDSAHQIIALLVADYPGDLRFRSLCGGVLNNRAMALAAAGKQEAAFAAFEEAIDLQRSAFERAPQVTEYREFLSKHYYNFAQALRAANRPERAAEVALERRKLWPHHGEHLSQVAVELAHAAVDVRALSHGADAQREELADKLETEVATTVRDAVAAGCDLAALRGESVFQLLQNSTLLAMINAGGSAGEGSSQAEGAAPN